MLGLLFYALIIGLIIWLLTRNGSKSQPPQLRDQLWLDYLTSFRSVVKTKQEKQLIETLIRGDAADELYGTTTKNAMTSAEGVPVQAQSWQYQDTSAPSEQQYIVTQTPNQIAPKPAPNPVSGTVLLLYFGAFLLVTSMWSFVTVVELPNIIRTITVALIALGLYAFGIWLAKTSKKLEQAGITFVGSGLIIAPLTGVAWYNLVANHTQGGIIWLITSVFCFALYTHALRELRNSFIAYMLIGSFVSAVQSSIFSVGLPSYSFGWGFVIAGLILAITTHLKGYSLEFNKASDISARILIPLSLFTSLIQIANDGASLQLSVTTALSGVYYGLVAWWQPHNRKTYALASQLAWISALGSITYYFTDTLWAVGAMLSIITGFYSIAIARFKNEVNTTYSLPVVGITVASAASIFSIGQAWSLVAGLCLSVVLLLVLWIKFTNDESLQTAGLILIVLPFIIGQYALRIPLSDTRQIAVCALPVVLIFALTALCSRKEIYNNYYYSSASLLALAITAVYVPVILHGFTATAIATGAIVILMVVMKYISRQSIWLAATASVVAIPLLHAFVAHGINHATFSASTAVALIWSIGVSLATRQAAVRWLVVTYMFTVPFALGGGGAGFDWSYGEYSLGYLLVMLSCLLARSIARGKLLVSIKVPVNSYYTAASQAYIVGYILAGSTAVLVSLFDSNSQLFTSIILLTIGCTLPLISYVEHNWQILGLLPFVLQGLLFSALHGDLHDTTWSGIMSLLSAFLAVSCYLSVNLFSANEMIYSKVHRTIQLSSVIAAYIGPCLVLVGQKDVSILLPTSLAIASLLTLGYNWRANQGVREVSLFGSIIALHWFIGILGITDITVHTHILGIILVSFAYWRYILQDKVSAINYGKVAFAVITIPLALRGLGDGGTLYGLILIAEQVLFMIIGASLSIRFLLTWSIWTAIAAILFQLRFLGILFMLPLAITIIGYAMYKLLQHSDEENIPPGAN